MENKQEKPSKGVFKADKVMINGPRMDGGYRVSFDVGEYQYNQIKDLPLLNGKILVVAVVQGEEFRKKGKEEPAQDKDDDMDGVKEIEEGENK